MTDDSVAVGAELPDVPVAVSAAWLDAVRAGDDTDDHEARLREWSRDDLAASLDTDDARFAFWINVYNAAAQSSLGADPTQWDARNRFFSKPLVTVAGNELSLDDVEHGILRRSRPKWGLGYVPNPFPGAFEKQFRVDERDPRVHFALNCGSAACPPIRTYSRERIDEQLETATRSYLQQEVECDEDASHADIPRLMLWFRGDFGGRSGIREFLRRYGCIPEDASPSFSYRSYDWSLDVGNWR